MKHLWTRTKTNIQATLTLLANGQTTTRAQTVKALMISRALTYHRANHAVNQTERFCALLIPWRKMPDTKRKKAPAQSAQQHESMGI